MFFCMFLILETGPSIYMFLFFISSMTGYLQFLIFNHVAQEILANTLRNNLMPRPEARLNPGGHGLNNRDSEADASKISEDFREQIKGLNQSSTNNQDGNSVEQTAENALIDTIDVLQCIEESIYNKL